MAEGRAAVPEVQATTGSGFEPIVRKAFYSVPKPKCLGHKLDMA
jgi:hypothetical protein